MSEERTRLVVTTVTSLSGTVFFSFLTAISDNPTAYIFKLAAAVCLSGASYNYFNYAHTPTGELFHPEPHSPADVEAPLLQNPHVRHRLSR